MTQVLPWIAVVLLLVVVVSATVGKDLTGAGSWRWFAAASVAFAVFSGYAVAREGLGFWAEHTRNLWGNQIWFDLLLAVGTSWILIVPRARARGMRLWAWLVFIFATGSVGLTAMVARLLWLEERTQASDSR